VTTSVTAPGDSNLSVTPVTTAVRQAPHNARDIARQSCTACLCESVLPCGQFHTRVSTYDICHLPRITLTAFGNRKGFPQQMLLL